MTIARPITRLALVLALLLPAAAARAADSTPDPRTLPVPPLHPVRTVTPQRFTLKNGAVVFLLEDHDLPSVSGTAYFQMGPALIPDNRVGLGSLVGEVMRSGGSAAHAGDWLDDRLAAIGATIGTSVTTDDASGDFRCLSDNTGEVVGLWAEVLRRPAFPADKIEQAKVGLRHAIASRNDEMIPLLLQVAREAIYGKGNPYARKPEYATVEPITAADCRGLHDRVFVPNRMVLAIYGDFKSAEMKQLLTKAFGDWAKSTNAAPVAGPVPALRASRLVFAPKDDVTQSGLLLAEPGSRADDPDYAALQVLEQALGGGFQSRLFSRIRTQRGLAYSAGASAGSEFKRPGVFLAYALTRGDSTLTTLDLLRHEVRAVTEAPFTDAELTAAKQSVQNGFVFNFEDPSQVLFRSAFYEASGYPADFLARYQKSLAAVDAATVLAAARRKVHPDQQVAIVVGKEADFDRKLESAGLPVERVDIAIPPPLAAGAVAVPASPEARARGRALLQHATELAGGRAAWAAVKTAVVETEGTLTMQGQTMNLTSSESWALPDRQLAVQKLPMGEMRQGTDRAGSWVSMMGQVQDNPKGAAGLRKDYERSLFGLFARSDTLALVALASPDTLGGVPCAAARVEGSAVRDLTLLFGADGQLVGTRYGDEGPAGPARFTVSYADWQPEGALRYPRTIVLTVDDQPLMSAKVSTLRINPPLADDLFRKPAAK